PDHHAAARGHGAPDQSGARAAWHDRDLRAPARAHDRLHLLRARREHHDIRRPLVKRMHVALVRHPPLDRHDHRILPHDGPQLVDDDSAQRHDSKEFTPPPTIPDRSTRPNALVGFKAGDEARGTMTNEREWITAQSAGFAGAIESWGEAAERPSGRGASEG